MSSLNLGNDYRSLAAGLSRVSSSVDTVSARISSGRRIDRPSVDSAGVGQAATLDSSQTRLRAVEVNIQNGVSRLQVTSGQLGTLGKIVTRLSEISSLAADGVQGAADKAQYTAEFKQLQEQLRQFIGGDTSEIGGSAGVPQPLGNFDGRALFGGGPADTLAIGENAGDHLALPVMNFRQGALGSLIRQDASGNFTLTLGSADAATLGAALNDALAQVADGQAAVGAGQSRLAFAAGVASTASANHEAALSAIQDTDVATATTELARLKMVSDSHTAMLTQARDVSAKLISLLSSK